MALGPDRAPPIGVNARGDLQCDDNGNCVRKPLVVEPSRYVEHGKTVGLVAGLHARRRGAVSAGSDGTTARGSRYLSTLHCRAGSPEKRDYPIGDPWGFSGSIEVL